MKHALLVLALLATAFFGYSQNSDLQITAIGTYNTGFFDEGGSEIIVFDTTAQYIYSVNGAQTAIDMIDASDPSNLTLVRQLDLTPYGASVNSVATYGDIIVAAVEAADHTERGKAVFFNRDGNFLNQINVGSLPDMITVTEDASKVLLACEGEPNDDYSVDPDGVVAIIDLTDGVQNIDDGDVTFIAVFANPADLDPSIRIFGNDGQATTVQDLEPEYITTSPDSKLAYVVYQENNAVGIIDLETNAITLIGLGYKDHSLPGNGFDASSENPEINIQEWPVFGMYQPDAITYFQVNGRPLLATANEGDYRDYDGYSEVAEVSDLVLDPTAFPNAAQLQTDAQIGELTVTTAKGDIDNDGDYDELYAFGARSFSIWDAETGALVFDSGDLIEQTIAQLAPTTFNSDSDSNDSFKERSDDQGPEPEAIAFGIIDSVSYLFVGFERMGGFMLFNVNDPAAPTFELYVNNRDFSQPVATAAAGDLGLESLIFVAQENSPTGNPLVITGNEVSGTVTVFEITRFVSTGEVEHEQKALQVYPNPVPNGGQLCTANRDDYQLVDTQGKVVTSYQNQECLNISVQAPGVYFLQSLTTQVNTLVTIK